MNNYNVNYNLNQKKQMAKIYVILGNTLKETANKTGLSLDQVKRISSKEKLIEKREDFLKSFYNKHWEKIEKNKCRRLELNSLILNEIEKEIELHGATVEIIKKYYLPKKQNKRF